MIPGTSGEIRITMMVGIPSSVPAGTRQRMARNYQGRRASGRAQPETAALVPGYSPMSLRDNGGVPLFHARVMETTMSVFQGAVGF
jgi:hypothetical protein